MPDYRRLLEFSRTSLPKLNLPSPCMGASLERGAKVMALLHLTLTGIVMFSFGVGLILIRTHIPATATKLSPKPISNVSSNVFLRAEEDWEEEVEDAIKRNAGPDSISLVVYMFFLGTGALFLVHYRYLYIGVKERCMERLERWWTLYSALTLFVFLLELYKFLVLGGGVADLVLDGDLLFQGYTLWVIWAYMRELREEEQDRVDFHRVI